MAPRTTAQQHPDRASGVPSIRRIVVGCDGSDPALAAARWAAAMAARLDAALDVVDSVQRTFVEMTPTEASERERFAAATVEGKLRDLGIEADTVTAVDAPVDDVLLDAAERADLFVIGSKAYEGRGKHGFGSLAHQLAHNAACPLVVVPRGDWLGPDAGIVCGIDGSSGACAALHWSESLGAAATMPVAAVAMIDAIYDTFTTHEWFGNDDEAARWLTAREHIELIERKGTDVAETLRDVAEERRSGLIVVSSRSHHSLDGLLLGTVVDELLHHPTRPVAVLTHRALAQVDG